MKIALSAAIFGIALAPAASLSYLDSLSKSNPVQARPSSGSSSHGASYLDALSRPAQSAPSGGGLSSYLDAISKPSDSSSKGSGMSSYLDNVGKSSAASSNSSPSTSSSAASSSSSSSWSLDSSTPVATTSGNYLEAINKARASGAPTGAGLTTYLDVLPRASATRGGPGIQSYTSTLRVASTASGPGFLTYTDALSGGSSSPIKSSSSQPSSTFSGKYSGSSSGSQVGFTLEAENLSELVSQLRGSGGSIRLSGTVESVSYN